MVPCLLKANMTDCQAIPNVLNCKCIIKNCRMCLKNPSMQYLFAVIPQAHRFFGLVFLFVAVWFFILVDSWTPLCAVPFLSNHDLTLLPVLSGLSQAQTDGSALDSNTNLKTNPPKQTSRFQIQPAVGAGSEPQQTAAACANDFLWLLRSLWPP